MSSASHSLMHSRKFSHDNVVSRLSNAFNTPYKSRCQSLYVPKKDDTQIKSAIRALNGLLKQRWQFFNVSPLFNFDTSSASMKRYASRLKERLLSNMTGLSQDQYEVSYSLIQNLKLHETDHDALEVKVVKTAENGKTSTVYRAILLTWGETRTVSHCKGVFLPIFLCHGLKSIEKLIHGGFQLLHDCFISPRTLDEEELRILSVYIIANASYKADDLISLSFSMPFKTKSGLLKIDLPSIVFSRLWASIHPPTSALWSDEEVSTFWSQLFIHISRTFGLDLACCSLERVSLPDISFTSKSGYVLKRDQMHVVLCFLMSLDNTLTTVAPHIHEVLLPK